MAGANGEKNPPLYDVGVVGAGPAGLNAALVLGRCGRHVLMLDSGEPRNAASRGLHGYLTRDGVHPRELRDLGRLDVGKYPSVEIVDQTVTEITPRDGCFEITTADRAVNRARIVLLATGRTDVVPDKPGFREYYGRGVYHCPYCDGWEHRGQKLVAYGDAPAAVPLALSLLTWSAHLTLCATDPAAITSDQREQLSRSGIAVAHSPVASVAGVSSGELKAVKLEDGTEIPCQALFFTADLPQKSPFAASLGCRLDDGGSVICAEHAATGVPGLYVAGNVRGGVHLAIMAAAEGAEAAIAINQELSQREHMERTR